MQSAADAIQQRAFRKMFELEGDDPNTEEQLLKSKGSQGKKPTVSGVVGGRVRTFKQKYKLDELQERPEERTGTPPGNMSMQEYLLIGKSSLC